jgi:hypothetical protein
MNAAAVQAETPAGAGTAPAVPAGGGRVRSGATGSGADTARRYPAGTPGAKGRQRWAVRSRAAASSTTPGSCVGVRWQEGWRWPARPARVVHRIRPAGSSSGPIVEAGQRLEPPPHHGAARRRPTRRLAGQKSVGAACRRLPGVGQRPRVGAVGGAAADQLQVSTRSARSAPRVLPSKPPRAAACEVVGDHRSGRADVPGEAPWVPLEAGLAQQLPRESWRAPRPGPGAGGGERA